MLRVQAIALKVNTVFKNVKPIRQSKLVNNNQSVEKTKNLKNSIFTRYLLATNLTISVCASGLGDFIEQMFEISAKYQSEWNVKRTGKMAFTGLPVGVICHYFYAQLDKIFTQVNLKIVIKKILLCQFVCSPMVIVTFYFTLGYLNKWPYKQIYDNIIEKGSKLFLVEWLIWPPALVFSFCFLTTRYRVLYDNFISLGFDVFNSYLVHNELRNTTKK